MLKDYKRLKSSGFTDEEILHITGWKKEDLPKEGRKRKKWTEKEEDYLREYGPYKTNAELANKLGRNISAVATRLGKLGIKKEYNRSVSKEWEDYIRKKYKHMSDPQLAEKIGCKVSQVTYTRWKMDLFKR